MAQLKDIFERLLHSAALRSQSRFKREVLRVESGVGWRTMVDDSSLRSE